MIRSRRKAREAALRTLYEIEIGHTDTASALAVTLEEANLPSDMAEYTERIVKGIRSNLPVIDHRIAPVVKDYDYNRIAVVDRNVLRIATYELFEMPEIPPAVTINEAIEIAKRYSTAESGKFVNGILGRLLEDSPKADWDPANAPAEAHEAPEEEAEVVVVEEVVEEGSDEAKMATKFGVWKIRSGEGS